MKRIIYLVSAVVFLFGCVSAPETRIDEGVSTFEVVSERANCRKHWLSRRLICNYSIGNDLKIIIDDVGKRKVKVQILKSIGKEGDFYASLIPEVGCITIHRGLTGNDDKDLKALADLAYISVVNGRVYKTWEECTDSLMKIEN